MGTGEPGETVGSASARGTATAVDPCDDPAFRCRVSGLSSHQPCACAGATPIRRVYT
jgi:hypothetical protein